MSSPFDELPPDTLAVVTSFLRPSDAASFARSSSSTASLFRGADAEPLFRALCLSLGVPRTGAIVGAPMPWRAALRLQLVYARPTRLRREADAEDLTIALLASEVTRGVTIDCTLRSSMRNDDEDECGGGGGERAVAARAQVPVQAYGTADGRVRVVYERRKGAPGGADATARSRQAASSSGGGASGAAASEQNVVAETFHVGTGSIRHMQFSQDRDGRPCLYTGSWSGSVHALSLEADRLALRSSESDCGSPPPVKMLDSGAGPVLALKKVVLVDEHGAAADALCYALGDASIRVIDLSTQRVLATFFGHREGVTDLAVVTLAGSPQLLVSASYDGTLRVWLLAPPWTCAATLRAHKGPVWSVATLTGGWGGGAGRARVCSAGADGRVYMWALDAGTVVARAGIVTRADSDALVLAPERSFALIGVPGRCPQIWCLTCVGGTLLGGTSAGEIHAWALPSGDHRWHFKCTGAAAGSLHVDADSRSLYVAIDAPLQPSAEAVRRDGVRRIQVDGARIVATMQHGTVASFSLLARDDGVF